ncbi:Cof-type HAD-IIB family hydrolase [Paenibacillus sp. LMG 31456]|uniref:Cof-type HAD-IIB family hydrolase n=1 Tax=Paenibacillus foliorum TaxID=2654974 RepID=A0A972K4C2_9BACL|nr:Cof-type HAD-IIB family hydrolase [Paenibacillus foliorum]NOU97915.1 Cof-type HAD-IIB family hydrolase [Paenibacillus foliorum]
MNYSMIALDVDGTLLNDRYEITDVTKEALQQAHASGIRIVLCTGRGPGNAVPILEQLGLEGVLITHNGAATVQTPGGILLHECGFSLDDVEPVIRYCRDKQVHFDVNTAFEMYVDKISAVEVSMYENYMLQPQRVSDIMQLNHPLVKFTIFGSLEVMDEVEQDLRLMEMPKGLQYIRSGDYFIDVMSVEASKGKALEQLAQQWNIPRERIIAMGNYYNDIEMLEYAGIGIAMDNSPEDVKAAADAVTLSNNDNGVYEALVKLGLV